jgi:peptidoglycan/LPS O-acetylase OafA/YrhL
MIGKIRDAHLQSEQSTSPKYRADIDGMRAIAIISVVGFHAFPASIKAGFIGVDIFFVISGFLISKIIFEGLNLGNFSFIDFYSRRIRRIFPALLLVLISCFAFGWFALMADEYKQLGKHILGGVGFVANFVLWDESGYFDNAAETKPLLHLWSLAIEEQFYVVWPLLLWIIWKVRFNPLVVALIICIVSFILNINKADSDPVAAFYSPQTRFWELLAGSILAYITMLNQTFFVKDNILNSKFSTTFLRPLLLRYENSLSNLCSILGGVVIFIGFIWITRESTFPGWWALFPVVGTILIMSAGSKAWLNRMVLSSRLLVWIGLISYPLYLWHYPLLSFSRILIGAEPPFEIRIAAILISVGLAWVTYRFVEKPIRMGNQSHIGIIILCSLMFFVGSAGFYNFVHDGIKNRYKPTMNDFSIRATQLSGDGVGDCANLVNAVRSSYCAKTVSPRVALVGDSHARHLFHGFVHSKNGKFNKVIYIGASACQPTLGTEHREGCDQVLLTAIDLIKNTPSIEYVVLSAWSHYVKFADDNLTKKISEGYAKTINQIINLNKKVVFVIDTPWLSSTAEACTPEPLQLRSLFKKIPSYCNGATQNDLVPIENYDKFIELMRLEHPDVVFYNPYKNFCTGGVCKVFYKSMLLYADDHHLSIYGSQYLVDNLVIELERLAK